MSFKGIIPLVNTKTIQKWKQIIVAEVIRISIIKKGGIWAAFEG